MNEFDNYIHIISHDLLAPLRNIRNLAIMVESEGLNDEERRKYLFGKIVSAASQATRVIEDLRALSKINTRTLVREKTNLHEIIEGIMELHAEKIDNRGASFNIELPQYVFAPPSLTWQLFDNCIRNALIHGIEPLQIDLEASEDAKHITFRISNPTREWVSDPSKLFEPFQQGVGSNNDESTGFGLYICRRITDYFGGDIGAYVEDDKFTIQFTLREVVYA